MRTKNFHALQNSVYDMAEESSLAVPEPSVGIQTTLSRTDVKIHSFRSVFGKSVKELDEKIVLFDLKLDIRTLPLRKNPLFRYTQDK